MLQGCLEQPFTECFFFFFLILILLLRLHRFFFLSFFFFFLILILPLRLHRFFFLSFFFFVFLLLFIFFSLFLFFFVQSKWRYVRWSSFQSSEFLLIPLQDLRIAECSVCSQASALACSDSTLLPKAQHPSSLSALTSTAYLDPTFLTQVVERSILPDPADHPYTCRAPPHGEVLLSDLKGREILNIMEEYETLAPNVGIVWGDSSRVLFKYDTTIQGVTKPIGYLFDTGSPCTIIPPEVSLLTYAQCAVF